MFSTQSGSTTLAEVLTDALATYRLTVLVKDDKITEDIRAAVFRRYGTVEDDNPSKPSYLVSCPWCLSIYFGAVAVAGRRFAPRAWQPLARILAFSATAGLLSESRSNNHS